MNSMNTLQPKNEQGSISVLLAITFGLLFVLTSIFALWAFSERQSYKNDVDAKIAAANKVAVQEAETAKDAEFVEKEKLPTRVFSGSPTYGAINFSYPKTWSVYMEENTSGTVIDVFAHPGVLPGFKSEQPYALRLEVTSTSYDKELATFDQDLKAGRIQSAAYRPEKVNSVLGVKLTGEIEREVQGALVLLPLRDRTIKLYTQSPEFLNDFNNIILPSLTFVP